MSKLSERSKEAADHAEAAFTMPTSPHAETPSRTERGGFHGLRDVGVVAAEAWGVEAARARVIAHMRA
jgi:hypothetical protein